MANRNPQHDRHTYQDIIVFGIPNVTSLSAAQYLLIYLIYRVNIKIISFCYLKFRGLNVVPVCSSTKHQIHILQTLVMPTLGRL
jgi:hypothetical protein